MKEQNKFLVLLNSVDFESQVEIETIDNLKNISNKISSYILVLKNRMRLLNSAIIIFGLAFIFINEYYVNDSYDFKRIIMSPINIFVVILIIFLFSWSTVQSIWICGKYEIKLDFVNRIVRRLQRQNVEKKEKITKDYIDKLMEINNDNISEYYQQVRKNSNNLFISGVVIGLIGFFLVFISLLVNTITNQNKDVLYISSITGILLDSFAGFFFVQYGNSTKNMKAYYDGLLLTQSKLIDKKMEKI